MDNTYKFETLQLHAGQESPDPTTGSRAVPIYQTTSFVFPSSESAAARFDLKEAGNIYVRITNPTADVFEQRISALEGGTGAVSTASGAAAIAYAVQNIALAGDHIITDRSIYGGTANYFANTIRDMGVDVTFVDASNLDEVKNAVLPNTKLIFIESMGNPNSTIVDIKALSDVAHENGIPLIVDNTFPTPYLLRPFEYGADIVVHSATKFLGGHGTTLGGVIVDGGKFDWKQNDKFPGMSQPNPSYHGAVFADIGGSAPFVLKARCTLLRDTGAALSPMNAFLLLQGLETLSLRVERHVENALAVVDFLENHPMVKKVNHPSIPGRDDNQLYREYFPNGGGSIFTFDLNGSGDHARKFAESLKLFSLLANVADMKSLVIHPASTTHSQLREEELSATGIRPETIRLSVGTEHIDDILADLSQALEMVR